MKHIHIIMCAAIAAIALPAKAQVKADNVVYERNGDFMTVKMSLITEGLDVPGTSALLLTPRIVAGGDSVSLPAVGIYSRNRYYYYQRRNGDLMLSGSDERVIREKDLTEKVDYDKAVPYRDWMESSHLVLRTEQYGCCAMIEYERDSILARLRKFIPNYVYVRPEAEPVKTRAIKGSAFVDFPVNITEIRPSYHSNVEELGKITASIDTVRNDKDVELTRVSMTGYASPEGSYRNNVRLAKGRTEAVRQYVARMYDLPAGTLTTSHVPENWAGLRAYVEKSSLPNKDAMLAIINSDEEQDARESRLKRSYPEQYRYLLRNCYPYLRRTDYEVDYNVKHFTDPKEIRQLITTRPQKLSLEEFYIAAQDMEPGSDEFNQVFDVAVRLFPNDETANLNAANAEMAKGDLISAEGHLSRAGQSPQAIYARGILAALRKDYATAADLFGQAQAQGMAEAAEALQQLPKR